MQSQAPPHVALYSLSSLEFEQRQRSLSMHDKTQHFFSSSCGTWHKFSSRRLLILITCNVSQSYRREKSKFFLAKIKFITIFVLKFNILISLAKPNSAIWWLKADSISFLRSSLVTPFKSVRWKMERVWLCFNQIPTFLATYIAFPIFFKFCNYCIEVLLSISNKNKNKKNWLRFASVYTI